MKIEKKKKALAFTTTINNQFTTTTVATTATIFQQKFKQISSNAGNSGKVLKKAQQNQTDADNNDDVQGGADIDADIDIDIDDKKKGENLQQPQDQQPNHLNRQKTNNTTNKRQQQQPEQPEQQQQQIKSKNQNFHKSQQQQPIINNFMQSENSENLTNLKFNSSNNQQQRNNDLMQIDQVFEELLMKMEVISVQNQYQGQFGVIGSSKVKDWTSPLTPPPAPAGTATANSGSGSSNIENVSEDTINIDDINNTGGGGGNTDGVDIDVVDGLLPRNQQHFYHQNQHAGNQQHQQQQQQHHHHHHLPLYEHEALKIDDENYVAAAAAAVFTNNNLVYCDPSPADEAITPILDELHFGVPTATAAVAVDDIGAAAGVAVEIDEDMVYELSQRLQAELRAAKSRHLACTEVSLPWDLTPRIAREILKISEREPCGVRGCSIFIEFEDEPNNTRRIASFKVDTDMVSTFELYLTLKHDRSGWSSLIPQFLRNLTRSNTILISPDFTLTKNKLYSCE